MITIRGYDHENNALVSSYTANELNQHSQRTVPGYACVRGSATNTATVTVNGNAAWRLGEYFYGGDEADNAASAVMKELDITAVVNPPGTNDADIVQSVTGRVFVAKSPETFTHDDDGNLLSDGRFIYTWDGENRLIAVETRSDLPASVPRVKVAYSYDHRSRRIGKQSYTWATDHWTPVTDHSFTYDGWNLIQELTHTQTHTLTNLYTWGLDLSGSLQGAGGVGGLLAVIKDGDSFIPAFDGNGNVCEYVSADGAIAAHYAYSPFGETFIQSGDRADAFAFRFSTKYWENEAKLSYYGYRFYTPAVGRWLNRDPIEENGGLNLYAFCGNVPVVTFDILGAIRNDDEDGWKTRWVPSGQSWTEYNKGKPPADTENVQWRKTTREAFKKPIWDEYVLEEYYEWLADDQETISNCSVVFGVGHPNWVSQYYSQYKPQKCTRVGFIGCWTGLDKLTPKGFEIIGLQDPTTTLPSQGQAFDHFFNANIEAAKATALKLAKECECDCEWITVYIRCQLPKEDTVKNKAVQNLWRQYGHQCNRPIERYKVQK